MEYIRNRSADGSSQANTRQRTCGRVPSRGFGVNAGRAGIPVYTLHLKPFDSEGASDAASVLRSRNCSVQIISAKAA